MKKGSYEYQGEELQLFLHATNWKSYWSGLVKAYIFGRVIDVGAGIGSTAIIFNSEPVDEWILIEPDDKNCNLIINLIKNNKISSNTKVLNGVLEQYSADIKFNTILYIDVLEHILDDKLQLKIASKLLNQNGSIIVLVPAHQYLYSKFDKSIGHFRRYSLDSIKDILPDSMRIHKSYYLDSMGLLGILFNKYILKNEIPSQKNIFIWDKLLIPISKILDMIIGYRFGKSLLLVIKSV